MHLRASSGEGDEPGLEKVRNRHERVATGENKVDNPDDDGHDSDADNDGDDEETEFREGSSNVIDLDDCTGDHEADTTWGRPVNRQKLYRLVTLKRQIMTSSLSKLYLQKEGANELEHNLCQ